MEYCNPKLQGMIGSGWVSTDLRWVSDGYMLVGETEDGRFLGAEISLPPLPKRKVDSGRRYIIKVRKAIIEAATKLKEKLNELC